MRKLTFLIVLGSLLMAFPLPSQKVADRRYIADGFYDETAEKQGFYVLSF